MPTHVELAAKLLGDAADFFETIAEQNPNLRDQMQQNASVFRHVRKLVDATPDGEIDESDIDQLTGWPSSQADEQGTAVFRNRAAWIDPSHAAAGLTKVGDRIDRIAIPGRDSWRQLSGPEAETWRDRLAPTLERTDDLDRLVGADLWVLRPAFYHDAELIHAVTEAQDAWFIDYVPHALGEEGRKQRAFGHSSTDIHETNAEAPLLLDGAELDYLHFFMHLIRSTDGPFQTISGPVLAWLRERLAATGEKDLADELTPPRFKGFGPDGACHYSAFVTYADRIFRAELKLLPGGMMEMLDDDHRYDGLAALVGAVGRSADA